jgi:hypothetical protein
LWFDHRQPAAGDGAHGELFMPGNPELENHEYVQERIQRGDHFVRHGHTAPGQAQHDNIVTATVMLKKTG